MPPKVILTETQYSAIIKIAKTQAPLEACGIIAGTGQSAIKIYPISNSLNSHTEYLMTPEEMVYVFWEIENHQWETVAFFHSHPHSQPTPSQADMERSFYPETPHLIIGRENNQWIIRGFLISQNSFQEIKIERT